MTEDYSPVPAVEDLILYYQRDPFGASDYIYCYLLKRRCFLPLLLLELVLLPLSAESKEPRALLRHFSSERRTSPLKEREIEWAKRELQSFREFRRRFSDTLFYGRLLNRNILYDVWASYRLLLSLDFPKFIHVELSRPFFFVVWTYFCVCVCVEGLVLCPTTVCVCRAWCWADEPCVCVDGLVLCLTTVCNLIWLVCVGLTSVRGGVGNFQTT